MYQCSKIKENDTETSCLILLFQFITTLFVRFIKSTGTDEPNLKKCPLTLTIIYAFWNQGSSWRRKAAIWKNGNLLQNIYLLIDSITSSEAFAAINFANHLLHTLSPTSFSQQSALYLRSHILVMLYVINLTIHLKHLFRFLPFCTIFIVFFLL